MDIRYNNVTALLSTTGAGMNAARLEGPVLENRSNRGKTADYAITSKWKWLFVNLCESNRFVLSATEVLNSMRIWEKLFSCVRVYVESCLMTFQWSKLIVFNRVMPRPFPLCNPRVHYLLNIVLDTKYRGAAAHKICSVFCGDGFMDFSHRPRVKY
jgi:hypothetical protein